MAVSFRGFVINASKCFNFQRNISIIHSSRRMLFSSNMEAKSSENNSSQKDNISNNDHKEPLNNTTKAGAVDAAVAEETFKQEKQKLLNQLNDYQDKYKRALAEMENVRQRLQRQVDDAKIFGIQAFCKDLLEVADTLQRAVENTPAAEVKEGSPVLKTLYEGLQMTQTSMQKVFTKHGLVQIAPPEGEKFDPNLHEALFTQPAEGKTAGTVVTVTKVGYLLRGRTLRPAVVGVYAS